MDVALFDVEQGALVIFVFVVDAGRTQLPFCTKGSA